MTVSIGELFRIKFYIYLQLSKCCRYIYSKITILGKRSYNISFGDDVLRYVCILKLDSLNLIPKRSEFPLLLSLTMKHIQIKNLHKLIPHKCISVKLLNCKIDTLENVIFPKFLENIYICGMQNTFDRIYVYNFSRCKNLIFLYLGSKQTLSIHKNSFVNNILLRKIRLYPIDNNFNCSIFSKTQVRSIKLSANCHNSILHKDSFLKLPKLKIVYLYNLWIKDFNFGDNIYKFVELFYHDNFNINKLKCDRLFIYNRQSDNIHIDVNTHINDIVFCNFAQYSKNTSYIEYTIPFYMKGRFSIQQPSANCNTIENYTFPYLKYNDILHLLKKDKIINNTIKLLHIIFTKSDIPIELYFEILRYVVYSNYT